MQIAGGLIFPHYHYIYVLCVLTTQAPRSKSQRGKARPKTSKPKHSSNMNVRELDPYNRKVYSFEVSLATTSVQQTATTSFFAAGNGITQLAPTLSFVDQASTYTGLFDQYRFIKVEWTFRPMFEGFNFQTTDYVPVIYTVCDYDDGVNPGSTAAMREYQNCQQHQYETFTISVQPHCADAVYGNSAFSSFGNVVSPWIDCTSTLVPHYGLKIGIDAGNTGQTNLQRWSMQTRLWMQFRNVR